MGVMNFEDTLFDLTGSGVTGSTGLAIIIRRVADDFLYDFNDTTFKNVGWTTKRQVMVEVDVVNLPGSYELGVTVTAWNDGEYVAYFDYDGSDAGLLAYRVPQSFWVRDGVEAEAVAMRGTDGANTVVPDLAGVAATLHGVTDGLINTAQGIITVIAADVANIDGAAMRGTNGAALAGTSLALDTVIDGTITLQRALTLLMAVMTLKLGERDGNEYTYRNQAGDIVVVITYTATSATAVITL